MIVVLLYCRVGRAWVVGEPNGAPYPPSPPAALAAIWHQWHQWHHRRERVCASATVNSRRRKNQPSNSTYSVKKNTNNNIPIARKCLFAFVSMLTYATEAFHLPFFSSWNTVRRPASFVRFPHHCTSALHYNIKLATSPALTKTRTPTS